MGPSEQVRTQLMTMMSVLDKSVTIIAPGRNKQEVGELRNKITDAYHQSKTRDHIRLLQRHKIIEERKEMLEQKNNAQQEEENVKKRREREKQKKMEDQRLQKERERRMSSRLSKQVIEWTRSTHWPRPRLELRLSR